MKRRFKRPLALLLTAVMLLTMLPVSALAVEGENRDNENQAALAAVQLKNAEGQLIKDLLSANTGVAELDGFTVYTLFLEVNPDQNAQDGDTCLTVNLPNGMKFVGLNASSLEASNTSFESVKWEKGEKIYNTYSPDNGTLTIEFKSGVSHATLSLSVQADMAFFPIEKAGENGEGYTIQDAISVKLTSGNLNEVSAATNAHVTSLKRIIDTGFGLIDKEEQNISTEGEESHELGNGGGAYFGYFKDGVTVYDRLVDKIEISILVPKGFEYVGSKLGRPTVVEIDNGESEIWTFTGTELYGTNTNLNLKVKTPSGNPNEKLEIKEHEIKVWGYGQKEPHIYNGSKVIWTLTLVSPETVCFAGEEIDASNVYNYTKLVNGEEKDPFLDYNTLFASAKIVNAGVAEIKEELIYEANFGQSVQFVTAVGIPCNWDVSSDAGLPTRIVVTDEENKQYTLSGSNTIRKAAAYAYKDQGFILRAENIPDFDTTKSIQSVKVTLPGLPDEYESVGQFPVFETLNGYHCYTAVWGRVRENVSGSTDTNTFHIYENDDLNKGGVSITSTTTVKETGTITGSEDLDGTLTVNGAETNTVASGGTIHVSQPINPYPYHQGSRSAESMIVDPVVYVLQPPNTEIKNAKFTFKNWENSAAEFTDISTPKGQEIPNDNLPAGWKLYKYRFSEDNVVLGWWDSDWNCAQLVLDFDYVVSPTAQHASYDLQDLIFYKSALELNFTRAYTEDKYNLNGDNEYIGCVQPNPFTITARSEFYITSAIQIEGESTWYEYNPDSENPNIAVFKPNAAAQVKVTVINNTTGSASDVVVYIPVPKQDLDLGDAFGMEGTNQFDMIAKGISGDLPEGWMVQYGTTEKEFSGNDADDLALVESSNWEGSPDKEHNIIKLTMTESGSLEPGNSEEFIFKFSATDEAGQTNRTNYFKSWWQFTAGDDASSSTMYDRSTSANFACRLQNGKLSGTVYVDANADGQLNDDEKGLKGVTVTVASGTGENQQTQTAITDDQGVYTFDALPSNMELILTVENPGSPNSFDKSAYRFTTHTATTDSQIGSDVEADKDHKSASKTIEKLNEVTSKGINAGLIEPLTVTLKTEDQARGSVSPTTVRVFSGDKIQNGLAAGNRITTTPEEGWAFEGWYKGENSTDLLNTNLESEEITEAVTYTAHFVKVPVGHIDGNTTIELEGADTTGTTTLTAVVTNKGELECNNNITYKWQKGSNGTWSDVSNANDETLAISDITLQDDGNQYCCIVTCGNQEATLGPVTLDVQVKKYSITVDENIQHGAVTTVPADSSVANHEVTVTAEPDTGYQLKEGSLKVTYTSDGEEQTVTVTGNKFKMPAADVTVSAEFEAVTYTISYVLNGGNNAKGNPTSYTVEQDITLNAPTKEGYTFTGWTWGSQTEPQTTVNLAAGSVTGNLTFTAHWQENPPTPSEKYTVTVEGSYAGSNSGAGSYAADDTVTIQAGTRENYTFAGWNVTSGNAALADASSATTTFTMPATNVTVKATWTQDEEPEPTPAGAITVTPADIIIYMGGKDGYEGTVNNEGEIEASSSLPEPGFVFELPEELETALAENSADITAVKFQSADDESKTWKVELYQGLDESAARKLYTIVPTYDKPDPVRMVFTDGEKHTVSDHFTVGLEINKEFGMSLYTGPAGTIKAVYGGQEYPVELGEGTLTVLGTTGNVSVTSVTNAAPTGGQPGAMADAGTTYTINDSKVEVTGGDVSLLFDDIINHIGNDRTSKLEARASEWLADAGFIPSEQHQFVYELKYLDLVDANNGNAWVTASDDLTIYWPLPTGVEASKVKVLHFKDLHRDMTTGQIESEIANCDVENLAFQVEGSYITFKVGRGGFSPFALVWEEKGTTPPTPATHTVTFHPGDHGYLDGTTQYEVPNNERFGDGRTVPDVDADRNYDFIGWLGSDGNTYTSDEILTLSITSDMTFTAQYKRESSGGGGGGGGTTYYTLHYESNGGTEYDDERYARNTVVDLDKVPTREGYTFTGWYAAEELTDRITEIKMTSNKTVYAGWEVTGIPGWLNGDDHFAYVIGYDDGTVRPLNNISRAEVATIIFRLLNADVREKYMTTSNTFDDVAADAWYNTAVSTLTRLGIINGRSDTVFDPNAAITRAEFAAICARFDDSGIEADSNFTDIASHWAKQEIERAATLGWIRGYEDGTFRPENKITRAEAMTLINRVLQRLPEDEDDLMFGMNIWTDNLPGTWYYLAVQEATNSHDYDRKDDGVHENWTGLNEDPDWTQYQ